MKKRLYIAYGSNLNLEQMSRRCPTAKVIGTSEIRDYELIFRGARESAVATIEKKKGSTVPIVVWEIKAKDERALDIYEGHPNFYQKQDFDIKVNGENITAMAYVMTQGHRHGVPSIYYYKTIYDGYKANGLDLEILDCAVKKAINLTRKEVEEERELLSDEDENNQTSMRWW